MSILICLPRKAHSPVPKTRQIIIYSVISVLPRIGLLKNTRSRTSTTVRLTMATRKITPIALATWQISWTIFSALIFPAFTAAPAGLPVLLSALIFSPSFRYAGFPSRKNGNPASNNLRLFSRGCVSFLNHLLGIVKNGLGVFAAGFDGISDPFLLVGG